MPAQIRSQAAGGFVAQRPVGLHRHHDDPIEVATQLASQVRGVGSPGVRDGSTVMLAAEPRARRGRIGLSCREVGEEGVDTAGCVRVER